MSKPTLYETYSPSRNKERGKPKKKLEWLGNLSTVLKNPTSMVGGVVRHQLVVQFLWQFGSAPVTHGDRLRPERAPHLAHQLTTSSHFRCRSPIVFNYRMGSSRCWAIRHLYGFKKRKNGLICDMDLTTCNFYTSTRQRLLCAVLCHDCRFRQRWLGFWQPRLSV